MRPRIKVKKPEKLLVFTTSKNKTMRNLAKFNLDNMLKDSENKTTYVMSCFGRIRTITKEKYDDLMKRGCEPFLKVIKP